MYYVDVILPLALDRAYTYTLPNHLEGKVMVGIRVEVAFGSRKLYSGLVSRVHRDVPERKLNPILAVLDSEPIVSAHSLSMWQWMADYYCCSLGEVMAAALPARLKLQSETKVIPGPELDDAIYDLDGHQAKIAQAVLAQESITIKKIRDILQIKSIYPYVKDLIEKKVIDVEEELLEGYKPKLIVHVSLVPDITNPKTTSDIFEATKNAPAQTRTMLTLIDLLRTQKAIPQKDLLDKSGANYQVLEALERKNLIVRAEAEVSRLAKHQVVPSSLPPLTPDQVEALKAIKSHAEKPILLQGVTGSGKTRIYVELIKEQLAQGRQVLFLVPEITLTTQLVSRMEVIFGENLLTYHSRMSSDARVEVWQRSRTEPVLILGARSSLFLPFFDVGLIVVDEEQDQSYKQVDPAPRYQARDGAVVLGALHKAIIILGSATPSLESYHNASVGKYVSVRLQQRIGNIELPEIILSDLRKEARGEFFSQILLEEIQKTKEEGQQTILFQNRRGFAPVMFCSVCGWHKECKNCDTTLVYHKFRDEMRCHLCGYAERPVVQCGECGSPEITLKGFGTEMIEDELKLLLPEYSIARLDLDTARGRKKLSRLMAHFEEGRYDILVGTQMVAKGLDFSNVGLVGVVNADQLLHYPDFRASERAFQLMVQVAGRAGRRQKRGRVVIQALRIGHEVIQEVVRGNYDQFAKRELAERKEFNFPPYVRLIKITVRHRDPHKSYEACEYMVRSLVEHLGGRVHGPLQPSVARVRNKYINEILLKLEKDAKVIAQTKQMIKHLIIQVKKKPGLSTTSIQANVDP